MSSISLNYKSRIPGSLVLLPIFWLVLAISPNLNAGRSLWVLVIVHGLLLAAVNGFSNYFQQQDKSTDNVLIIRQGLVIWVTSTLLFSLAVIFAFLKVSSLFALLVAAFGIGLVVVNANSKKYPLLAWILTGLIQGFFIFILVYIGINQFSVTQVLQTKIVLPALLSTMVLWSVYPVLYNKGIAYASSLNSPYGRQTFILLLFLLTITALLAGVYLNNYLSLDYYPPLLIFYGAAIVFLYFNFKETHTPSGHTISHPLIVSWITLLCLNGFFFYLFTDYTHIFQLL